MKMDFAKYGKQLKQLPEPLQKQIFIRFGFALISLLFFALVLNLTTDLLAIVPFIGLAVYSVINAILLYKRGVVGAYVVIRGRCAEASDTLIRKRTKAILLETEEHLVRVILRQRLGRIRVGTEMDIYVADNTQVYDKDGAKLLQNYIAINLTGGQQNAESGRSVSGTKNSSF
jgi:hypothetical protein